MMRQSCLITFAVICVPLNALAWGGITHYVLGLPYNMELYCSWPDWVDASTERGATTAIHCHQLGGQDALGSVLPNLPFSHALYVLAKSKVGFEVDGKGATSWDTANIAARAFALHALQDEPVHYELFPFGWYGEAMAEHTEREDAVDCVMFYERIVRPRWPKRCPPPKKSIFTWGLDTPLWPHSGFANSEAAATHLRGALVWIEYKPGSAQLVSVALECMWKEWLERDSAQSGFPDDMFPANPYSGPYAKWTAEDIERQYGRLGEDMVQKASHYTWQKYYDSIRLLESLKNKDPFPDFRAFISEAEANCAARKDRFIYDR